MSLFSEQAIKAAIKKNEEIQHSRELLLIPRGANTMTLKSAEFGYSKNANIPVFQLTWERSLEPEKYRPIKEQFYIKLEPKEFDKDGNHYKIMSMSNRFYTSFGYTLVPLSNPDPNDSLAEFTHIILQLKKFEGKRCRAVIKHQQKLLSGKLQEYTGAEIYYTGLITDDKITPDKVDASKLSFGLTKYDRDKLNGVTPAKANASAGTAKGTSANGASAGAANVGDAPHVGEEVDDDLPF